MRPTLDQLKASAASVPPPPPAAAGPQKLVEHFFRHESGRLHGALLRRLGVQHLSLIEDVVQEAMLRALHAWSMGGIPPNPSAWISRVAINLAHDALRHRTMSVGKEDAIATYLEQTASAPATTDALGDPREIRDDALRLLFVCCHPSLAIDAQAILALKVLCGFNTSEIARAFLAGDAAIEKQLTRTKQRLRQAAVRFELPEGAELAPRLAGVLSTLYLLFNEGYKASAGRDLIREDLCREAIRLAQLLVDHGAGDTPATHALLALMLLNAARFPTRLDEQGDLLRLHEQDRSRWDPVLIDRGLEHFARAAEGADLTEYHLQAAIAACHCTSPDASATDWPRILRLYDDLYRLKPSPIIALNRAVARSFAETPRAALSSLATMPYRERLESHYLLHAVLGELHWRDGNHRAAAGNFRRALSLVQVGPEQTHLERMLARSAASLEG